MKTLTLALCLLTTTITHDWKKDRSVEGFSGLRVSSGINVYLTQGNSEKLTLDVKGLEEEDVKAEVKNGTLNLYIERRGVMNWVNNRNTSVKAYVTFRALKSIQASGGADVTGQGHLTFQDLDVQAGGGADVALDLTASRLNVSASGGADAKLTGRADLINAASSGGSDLDARNLTAKSGTASSSGGSDVYIRASDELSLKASGGSDIYYYGSARVLTKQKSGGSDISHRD